MTEITEAVELAKEIVWDLDVRHELIPNQALAQRHAKVLADLLSELTRLQEENGQLRLAICGGEDAPGYADSLPLADILGVAANNLGSWREASDRAARLQEEVKGLRDEDQIKAMVERFLAWKLPADFSPDAGISFKAEFNENTAHPMRHEPRGTNLLNHTQAEAMVRHLVGEMAAENTVGAAEAEVGRYVYRRIEALMGATDGTAEGRELSYLSAVAASVEEYGEEACAGTDLAAEHFGQEGAVEPVAFAGEVLEKIGALGRKPVIGKYQASNYVHLRDTIAALDARDLRAEADTIVWLCWWRVIDHNREEFLVANTKEDAQARIAALAGEARAAAAQFRFYAESHAAKGTPDGDAKARTNIEWAERLERAALNQGADHGG